MPYDSAHKSTSNQEQHSKKPMAAKTSDDHTLNGKSLANCRRAGSYHIGLCLLTTSHTCLFFNQLFSKTKKGEGLFRWQSLEILQRRINYEFEGLGLPYYIRIYNCNILTGIFEYAIESRYGFVSGEDTKERAHEIAEKLLKNMILDFS